MIELTENNYLYFYSTIAQVFGALLGLLGLTFVRRTDDIYRNVDEYLNNSMKYLYKLRDQVKENYPESSGITFRSSSELEMVFKPYMEKINSEDYDECMNGMKNIESLHSQYDEYSKQFKHISYLSAVLIACGVLGLMFPYSTIYMFHYILMAITAIIALAAIYLSSKFFISILDFDRVIIRVN